MKMLNDTTEIKNFFGTYPLTASSIRTTMACNARCKHCYANGGKKLSDEFSKEEIFNIIDQLSEMKISQIFFTGGEPFLRKDIVEILEYANSKEFQILISTNGTIINEETIKCLSKIKFQQFQVSIDGLEKSHDENRGKGFFEKAINTIHLLQKYNVTNITVGTCITRYNCAELPDLLQFVIDQHVDKFALMLLLPEGRANLGMDVDISELVKSLNEFWNIYRKNDIKFSFADNSVLPPVFVPEDLRAKGVHKKFICCCAYPNLIGISATGDVAPCDGFLTWEKFIGGNIRKKPISQIWNDMQNDYNIIPYNVMDIGGICSKCKFLTECGGNCRADSVAYYGSLFAPYPICQHLYEAGLFPEECIVK